MWMVWPKKKSTNSLYEQISSIYLKRWDTIQIGENGNDEEKKIGGISGMECK